jgi:hypothetical protein
MSLLSNRSDRVVAAHDENGDGVVDQSDDALATQRVANGDGVVLTQPTAGRAQVDERLATHRRLEERTAARPDTTVMPVVRDDSTVDAVQPVSAVPEFVAKRPRSSLLATFSLIFGVAAALSVLTGVLAGPGVVLGLVAAFIGIGGISATTRRHVAGKMDALVGVILGLAAIVVGSLAYTGSLSWLSTSTNEVVAVHNWLLVQLPWLFPSS